MKGQWILVYALILGLLLALLVGLNPISSLAADRGSGADSLVSEEAAMLEAPTLAEAAHEGVDADWWSAVQEHIRRSEYQVTWQEQTYLEDVAAAYQAPNRAENLRTYFAPEGPIVIPRVWGEETASPPWRWQASLVAWGRAGALRPVSPAQLRVEENRIEYQREGLVEWYRNDEEGLEQGFTLPSAPEGGEAGQPLQLALALAGDMVPEMILEGAGIEFRTAEGDDGLRYGRLRAVDAAGQSLPARLELQGATLSIWVEDAGAAYPIEVDPTIRGLLPDPYWSITFGSLVAEYGSSVGTAGDVNGDGYSDVIVGVPGYDGGLANQGQAYVYHGSRDGLGVVPEWYKGIGQAGAHFGAEVATAGDVNGDGYADVIIGAPEYTGNTGHEEEGGIWVYHGSADGLEDDYATHDEGNQADARFGHSVATAGDVNGDGYADVIVGAPLFASPTLEEGRVWVWHGSEDGLSEYHNWRAESNQAESGFGVSASTAGDINGDGYADVIVGAHRYRVPDAEYGVVFIWLGSADGVNGGENGTPGNAHQDRVLWDSGARFGHSVSTAGDVNGDGYADVIVGAPFYDDGASEEGAAFLYLGSDSGIDGNYVNMDQGGKVGARLGWTVATAGDVNGDGYADVIVGAPDNSIFNPGEPGRAFVWHGQPTSTGISTTRDWDAEGEEADARFGFSVGTAGDVDGDGYSDIIVGSPGNAVSAGSAYVYHGRPDDVSEEAGWIRASNKEDALFGHSVGTAGDVNGDGYADVVVGAPGWDGGQMLEGEALVYLGSADGLETVPNWYKQSNKTLAKFGTSAGTAGDVNGDGYDDIIVGAPGWHNPETDEGAAWVYHGSNTGVETTSSWGVASNGTGAKFGTSVGTAGDVNGDGYSDVVVGAPFWQQGGEERGAAFIYHGTENGLHTSSDTYLPGDQADAEYGHAVGTAGDVNRDGYSDVIVGAPKWDGSNLREGHAWVYHGSRRGLQRTPRWDEGGSKFNAQYGFAVGTAGDVNGDGYADIIVGAPYWYDDHVDEGKVWVYHGSSMGLGATSSWRKEGGQTGAHYGYSVGTAGDVNGDGIADVIIGVEGWNGGQTNEGGASLYHGSYGGLEQSRSWHGEGDQVNAYYGTSVGTAGDVNGDGYADVIVGAPKRQRSGGPGDEGQAFLYYGNGGRGVALRPVQEQEDDSPLAHLGRLSTWDSFLVFVLPESPFGRGGMALEVEAKPLGVPFDGSGTVRWMAYWVHAPGQAGSVLVDNLIPDMPYHWRVRWRYDPATTPWLPASRWMTNPWNGWQETDFRTGGGRIMLPLALGNYD
jgi:hypothetical protein